MEPRVWSALADLLAAAHAAWIAAVLLLPIWALRRPRLQVLQLSMLGIVLAFELLTGGCPVTDLEKSLRARAGSGSGYSGGFIEHQFERLEIDLPRGTVGGATAAWLLLWGGVYARRRRRLSVR